MNKTMKQQLDEIEEQKKALALAEKNLLSSGKPYAIEEIKQLVVDFDITNAELDGCKKNTAPIHLQMSNSLIKKHQEFLNTYPQYKRAHENTRVEFQLKKFKTETEKQLALNHEFDQFLSWIYETNNLSVTKWPDTPLRDRKELFAEVRKQLKEWKQVAKQRLADEEAFKHLSKLKSVFKSEEKLRNSSDIAIHSALTTLHSYRNALRRGEGKTEPQHIFAPAQSQKLRNSLSYLLFSKSPIEERIANMCFNPAFDIKGMGVPMITELIGWHHASEPLINDRVATVLRFLGNDVEPFPIK